MRKELKNIGNEQRHVFTGIFVKYGFKNGWNGPEPTLMLKDIKDQNGNIVTDHLWFNKTKAFSKFKFTEGDVVQFSARVKQYTKGYKGYDDLERILNPVRRDYKLSYPTKIQIIQYAEFDEGGDTSED